MEVSFAVNLPPTVVPAFEGEDPENLEVTIAASLPTYEQRLISRAEELANDHHLSATGRLAKWSEDAAGPVLQELHEKRSALSAFQAKLEAERLALEAAQLAKLPTLSDVERALLANAYREASPERRQEALAEVREGRNPTLGAALVNSDPLLSGLESFEVPFIRATVVSHLPGAREAEAAQERLAQRIYGMQAVLGAVGRLYEAVAAQALPSAVPPAALPRKAAMTNEEKALFLADHGHEAFQALPD